jgi:hypothetical protein
MYPFFIYDQKKEHFFLFLFTVSCRQAVYGISPHKIHPWKVMVPERTGTNRPMFGPLSIACNARHGILLFWWVIGKVQWSGQVSTVPFHLHIKKSFELGWGWFNEEIFLHHFEHGFRTRFAWITNYRNLLSVLDPHLKYGPGSRW